MNLVTCFLLLLAALTVYSDAPERCTRFQTDRKYTIVEYKGHLHCSLTPKFCAMIYYMEHDSWSKNEDVGFVPVRCTENHTLSHHTYVNFRDGDGPFDSFYDPRIQVIHNCEEHGLLDRTQIDLQPVDINFNVDYLEYEFNITSRGAPFEKNTDWRYKDLINQDTQEAKDFLAFEPIDHYPGIFDMYDEDMPWCS